VRKPVGRPPAKPAKRRKKKPRIDITLTILDFFANIGRGIKKGYLRVRQTRYFRVVSAFTGVVFVVLAAMLTFSVATRPNALEIYLGDTSIGTIRLDGGRQVTLEYITRHAAARMETQLGSHVRFESEIEARLVRVGTGATVLTFDNMVTALINAVDYYVWGAVIIVDGNSAVSVSSQSVAESLLRDIAQSLQQGSSSMPFHHAFVEEVEILHTYVRREYLMTHAQAYSALTTPREVPGIHTVQRGDTFWGLEQRYGMSVNDIIEANPDVNPDDLRVGQVLEVVRTVPVLTLRD